MEATLKDYYRVLGVAKDAGEKEIKTAYRKLARAYHPDTKSGRDKEAAEERIKEINEAYGVLGSKEKRAEYDELMEALKNPRRAAGRGFAPGAGFRPAQDGGYTFHWEGGEGMDPEMFGNLFSDLFGEGRMNNFSDLFGGAGRGASRENPFARSAGGRNPRGWSSEPQATAGQHFESEVQLTVEEAFEGGRRTLRFTTSDADSGQGAANGRNAGNGRGSVRTLEVNIPPGVRDGSVIRLQGQGSKGHGGGPDGDMLLTVRLKPDARFKLDGDAVETEISVRPDQAALGCQIPVKTLDGRVRLTIPAMTRNGHRLRLPGKGWPRKQGGRGDLLVRVRIDLPEHLSEKEKKLYRQLAEERKD